MEVTCGNRIYPIDEIVQQYTDMLYRVAVMKMKNVPDAEEVVQETFLRLIKQIKSGKKFESEEHLKAWLLRVEVNHGNTILSSIWNNRTQGMDDVNEKGYEDDYDFGSAYDYVLKLPEKYRIAIQLHYYEDLKTEEIAEIMRTKPSTVRSYLKRGRDKLKELIGADLNVEMG